MKKYLSVFIILSLMLSLAACTFAPASNEKETSCAEKPDNGSETAEESGDSAEEYIENPNYLFGGYVAEDGEYTYFINSTNGEFIYRIIRIGNAKSSDTTVIYSVPETEESKDYWSGHFSELSHLAVSEDRIYFLDETSSSGLKLKWVSKDGKATGLANCSLNENGSEQENVNNGTDGGNEPQAVSPTRLNALFYDGHYIYISCNTSDFSRFNLNTDSEETLSLYGMLNSDEHYYIIGVHRNKAYYVKGYESLNNGIYYTDLNSMEEKELCAFDVNSMHSYPIFSGDYMFYSCEDGTLESINLKSSEKYTVCDYSEGYGMDFIVRNGTVYYFSGSDIWTVSPDGTGAKLLIEDSDKDSRKTWMQIAGSWIYYGRLGRNDPEFYRVPIDGKIFPSNTICRLKEN